GATGANAPTPRSSVEWITHNDFKRRWGSLPTVFTYQFRNARGRTSFPSENVILDRNTMDQTFGFGITPTLHIGSVGLSVNPSLAFTIRRDANVPTDLDQNLVRQQLYLQTTPIFNWLTIKAYGSHESGPFIRRYFSSRDNVANLDFTVGRPWGRNALVTGYHI